MSIKSCFHFIALSTCVMAVSCMTACVASPPYNPDHLDGQSFARISDICQTVMGLSPQEPLYSGNWPGNSRLDNVTNHYEGCILSLSDTQQSISSAVQKNKAEKLCRAKGFKPETPELALCVLNATSNPSEDTTASPVATVTPVSSLMERPKRSFFTASSHEISQRERVACATLGISPSDGAFRNCVEHLNDTFHAIDNPVN